MGAPRKFPAPLLPGEHALATDPPLARETGQDWRRRPRAFTGRALTHHALETGQVSQAGMQRLRGQAVSAGTLQGLGVLRVPDIGGPDPLRLTIANGNGLARSGEDVKISGGIVDLATMRIMAPPEAFETEIETPEIESEPAGVESAHAGHILGPPRPRVLGPIFGELEPESGRPNLAVLIAQPVTVEMPDPGAPHCPPDRRDIGWLDPAHIDGTRLVLYTWPDDVRALGSGLDYRIDHEGPRARSRIAQRIFALEALQSREAMHPWEEAGLPLALVAFDAEGHIAWIDAAAVQRRGGQPPLRSHIPGTRENPVLAEARLAQFSAHLAELGAEGLDAIRREIAVLPPAGVLPGELVDVIRRSQTLLPDGFDISLTPAMAEEIDRLVEESAGLAPIALEQPEKLELLLPVPAREYDTQLLEVEMLDPRFAATRASLLSQRGHALRVREDMRRRFDVLGLAARGLRGSWPSDGATESELAPEKASYLPQDTARAFLLVADGSAPTSLTIADGIASEVSEDSAIFVWVQWEDGQIPSQVAVTLKGKEQTFAAHWGKDTGSLGEPRGDGFNYLGELLKLGEWQRLEAPIGAVRDKDGKLWSGEYLEELTLAISGGQARLGAIGILDASGSLTYLSNGLLTSGLYKADSKVEPIKAKLATRPEFGTAIRGDLLQSSALSSWTRRWNQEVLQATRALAVTQGLEATEADLDARLKRTNDSIDVGFVRARADIYRLRQYILGRDDASRLVTSPALADLAVRDESARASADDLADFLSRMKDAEATQERVVTLAASDSTGVGSTGGTSTAPAGTARPDFLHVMPFVSVAMPHLMISQPANEAARSSTMVVSEASTPAPAMANTNPATPFFGAMATHFASEALLSGNTVTGGTSSTGKTIRSARSIPLGSTVTRTSSTTSAAAKVTVRTAAGNSQTYGSNIAATKLGLFNPRISAADIVGQKALPGIVERTVTVAERIKQSAAAKTHEYALAGKLAVINTLTRLIGSEGTGENTGPGIVLADLPAPGFALRKAGSSDLGDLKPATLADIVEAPAGMEWIDVHNIEMLRADRDGDNASEQVHEIAYFSAAVAAIDDAIALMRLVEGRVDFFEKVLADVRRTLALIRADGDRLEAALEAQDADLAEIRHDLSVAEALEAEERAHVAETNARRAATIARHSGQIVFRRPRLAPIVNAVASAAAYPANPPDPVVTCLADHADQPEELREYCGLFHDAPVGWFPEVSRELARLDRITAAQKVLTLAVARAAALPILAQTQRIRANRAMTGVHARLAVQRTAVERMRASTARLDLSRLARFDLAGLHQTIRQSISMADLLDGARERPALARLVSRQLENISNVAACLHAAFAEVEPALRMRWAQIFSVQDEAAPSLAALGALPGWRSVPLALRRELQDLTNWLFARVGTADSDATEAMDGLIRIALLLAAHAPVDELVPASLVEPVPLRPGGLVPLRIPPERVWLGQTGMIRDSRGRALATIRAETITSTLVEARIIRDFGLAREVTQGMPIALGGMRAGR